jgi:hypothetical protein
VKASDRSRLKDYSLLVAQRLPIPALMNGSYSELSEMPNLKTFVTTLAGHIAAEAARS